MRKQRDEAREDSIKGAREYCDLKSKLRGTENELYYANEKLQDANNGMMEERKEFRDSIQELNDLHLVDEENIRSLKQDLSNTECDRDEYCRKSAYASRESEKLARENQKLARENGILERQKQQLEASLAEKDETIKDLQIRKNDTHPHFITAVSRPPINIQSNDEIESRRPTMITPTLRNTALQLATTDREVTDVQGLGLESSREREAERGEDLEKQVTAKDGELARRDGRIQVLEQQNGTLTSEIGGLRIDLTDLRSEHGTQLAEKDEEMKILKAEKKTADEESAEAVAALREKLREKEQEVTELEEANGNLVAEAAPSANATQRLNELGNELELSRQAHSQCDERSTSQSSRIDELLTAQEQQDETLRAKGGEIFRLQAEVTLSNKNLEDLQGMHARCDERATTQTLEITGLRNANELLQGTNGGLSQQLGTAQIDLANLNAEYGREQQQTERLRRAGLDLERLHQNEVQTLQNQIWTLNGTVNDQQESIHALQTNCPKCQQLREALDEVLKDDDQSRAELKKQVTVEVRAELRSQVPDDLRRQIRTEMEQQVRENYRKHYSDQLANNTRRIKEQANQLSEKDAELEKFRNRPTADHAACENTERNLNSAITKLRQDARIAKESNSRLSDEAKHYRQQFDDAQPAMENLRSELEQIKADQRRAQNINPLQSRLTRCQRDLENMRVDRDKVRSNCSEYSKQLSILRNRHKALEDEYTAVKEKSIVVQNEQPPTASASASDKSTVSTLQNEVARLSKELAERKARDKVQDQAMINHGAQPGYHPSRVDEDQQQWPVGGFVKATDEPSLPSNGGEKSNDELEGGQTSASRPLHRFHHRHTHQPVTKPVLGKGAGTKREYDGYSSGEADDERSDDRKKVKTCGLEDGVRLLNP